MLRRSAFINLTANALASLISAVTILLVIRNLDVAAWGVSATVLGVGQFLGSAIAFGSQTRMLRELSVVTGVAYRRRSFSVPIARLLSGVVMSGIGFVGYLIAPLLGAVIILGAGVFVSLGAIVPFLAKRRYVVAGGLLLVEKVAALSVAMALINVGLEELGLPIAIGAAGLLSGALSAFAIFIAGGRARVGDILWEVRRTWENTLHFGIAAVAPSALLLDVGIVALMASTTEAGQYAVGSRLTAPLSVAATTLVQVLMPTLSNTRARLFVIPRSRNLMVATIVMGILFVFLIVLAPTLLALVLGPSYSDAAGPIRFFILNAGLVLVTRTLVTALQAWNHERDASVLVAGQVLIAISGIAVASSLWGATAAAAAVFLSNLILAGMLILAVRRVVRNSGDGGL